VTLTVEEAKADFLQLFAKAEAGEEILIAREKEPPSVKLVPFSAKPSRLTPHPTLSKALVILDDAALVKPLPPAEWGDLGTP